MNILVTGGAGFIGTHVVKKLRRAGHIVETYDLFESQVHGAVTGKRRCNLLHPSSVSAAIKGRDAVVHLGAQVGVGQSMYDITKYVEHNCVGTANVLQGIIKSDVHTLVVASSMSVYGEGWPSPIYESAHLKPESIYAVTKRDQEELCLVFAKHYGLDRGVALRLFNTYGEGQSLNNPYTGAAAIFASSVMNGYSPLVYEDGCQTRDYVHVDDTSDAIVQALTHPRKVIGAFNVGTGIPTRVIDLAQKICDRIDPAIKPFITGKYRAGDIRHCSADITKMSREFGYQPRVPLDQGLDRLCSWIRTQTSVDKSMDAHDELVANGLIT